MRCAAAFLIACGLTWAAPGVGEPLNVVRAPAANEAPMRVEAAMFDLDVNLAEASSFNDLLVESGIEPGEAASAAALAQGQLDDEAPVRVKLGLSRSPDTGAVSLQRVVLATASTQTVIEQRGGKLRIVSSALRKQRLA